jgi:glycosyltransferase involved in cell wall biosynthesis
MSEQPVQKILHVVSSMDPKEGGVCQAVRTIVAGLSTRNIYSEVVSLDDAESFFFKSDPFTVHALGRGKGPWRYNKRLTSWFVSNLSYFDKVIVHGLWTYMGFSLQKAIKNISAKPGEKIPKVFVMPHGMLDPYFQRASGRKMKALRNTFYWKFIENKLINTADGILFTCEEEAALAKLPFKPYQPKKTYITGLGVEHPPVYVDEMKTEFESRCPQLDNSPYLLFLSRINEKKGVDLLLDAYLSIIESVETNPRSELAGLLPKLVIAGPDLESEFGKKIQKQVEQHHLLRKSVIFTGMLSGLSKWGAFYGCEAFILPSHQENFGIAVVEALGCSKPVLISNQVNIWREINEDGGCYVSNNTIDGTRKLLESWGQSSYKTKRMMSKNAFYSFTKNFAPVPATTKFVDAISNPN